MSNDHAHPIFAPFLNALSGHRKVKIVTEHVYPPIPTRHFDWSAVLDDYDGAPDAGWQPHGTGSTEDEAIQDLLDQLEAEEDPRFTDAVEHAEQRRAA